MQHYIAEESNLHERALQAVKSVTTSSKTETETETDSKEKEIIADVLRGFLLLENAALIGSEQVIVFGVAGKSYAYNHIANALRETWGNDERLRSHDSALSQQLQSGHVASDVHGSAEDNEWTEADYDCEESLNGMTPKEMMTSTFPKKLTGPRIITRPATTTTTTTLSPNTVPHFWTNLSKHRKKTRSTLSQARQLMKDVHRSRGYFPVSKGNSMDVDQAKGKSQGPHWDGGKGKRTVSSGKRIQELFTVSTSLSGR